MEDSSQQLLSGSEEGCRCCRGRTGKVDIQDEVTDVICDNCGRHMVIKYGPHGRFLACPGFPECKNTKPYFEKIGCGMSEMWKRDCA